LAGELANIAVIGKQSGWIRNAQEYLKTWCLNYNFGKYCQLAQAQWPVKTDIDSQRRKQVALHENA
jgi:hypothetical protein